jgi:hypothetical protein
VLTIITFWQAYKNGKELLMLVLVLTGVGREGVHEEEKERISECPFSKECHAKTSMGKLGMHSRTLGLNSRKHYAAAAGRVIAGSL